MMATASLALDALMAGNERFRTGNGTPYRYTAKELSHIAETQSTIAAILTCSDSRVAPGRVRPAARDMFAAAHGQRQRRLGQ